MADTIPFHLRIKTNICEALKQIDGTGGYFHDLGNRVFRGQTMFGEDTVLPFVSLIDTPLQAEELPAPLDFSGQKAEADYIVQGFCVRGDPHPDDPADLLASDIMRVLGAERDKYRDFNTLNLKRVLGLRIGQPVVRPPDTHPSEIMCCWIRIGVTYVVPDLTKPLEAI